MTEQERIALIARNICCFRGECTLPSRCYAMDGRRGDSARGILAALRADPDLAALLDASEAQRVAVRAVLAPRASGPVAPMAGQIWQPTRGKALPRTVLKVAAHRSYKRAGDQCVYFSAPGDEPSPYPRVLSPDAWRSWVTKTGAVPYAADPTP